MSAPRYSHHPDAAWRQVGGHVFCVTPDNVQHEMSGDVEQLVWSLCGAKPQTLDALVQAVKQAHPCDSTGAPVSAQRVTDDISEFLTQLTSAGLLSVS